MTPSFEADVALLHLAGGAARVAHPPGTLAQAAPRRCARGRAGEFFFISLGFIGSEPLPAGFADHLASLAAEMYFGTPGSVTAALREAASIVNDRLLDANQEADAHGDLQGKMVAAVLRQGDLYLAQCGPAQAILIRPGHVTRLTSEEAASRPLGISMAPYVRYHHFELKAGDLFILSTAAPDQWSDATLSGLATLEPTQAVDRLAAAGTQDLTGLLARVVAGDGGFAPQAAKREQAPSASRGRQRRRTRRPGLSAEALQRLPAALSSLGGRLSQRVLGLLSTLFARLAPGLDEPLRPDMFSERLLAGTAIVVPLIVVTIAALVYFRQGRGDQFRAYLSEAQAAVALAEMKPLDETSRADWDRANDLLKRASAYGSSETYTDLRARTQAALDALDLVVRLDFRPVIAGGVGSGAQVTALAASATDLYILDSARQAILHAWGAPERGMEFDSTFDCLGPKNTFAELGPPVDMAIQQAPGALGAEGVVAIDGDGTILYCAPDRKPALTNLTPPDIGWGRIQAIDVFGDSLYVLDPSSNAVWIYQATGGFFSGTPEFFFTEEVRDLKGAIDLALAQDELVVLYADGRVDRCRRFFEPSNEGKRIRVECEDEPRFQDDRAGHESTAQIPGAVPIEMIYSPPPEPSLFFLDSLGNRTFHYSLRLVYQSQYLPLEPFSSDVSALAFGPPNDLYIAAGSQIYHAQPIR